jgi:DNA-binding response OmpR family regulator
MTSGRKKILIAEDERPMAWALQMKFQQAGFEAKAVMNGQDALKLLKQEPFDLLLLDLVMPKMDGFAVLQELQINHHPIPIIISSNLSQAEDEKRARELGAKDYFIKSNIPIAEVVKRVKEYLEKI